MSFLKFPNSLKKCCIYVSSPPPAGSQACLPHTTSTTSVGRVAEAVQGLGIPTFCGGMSRGQLGDKCEHQFRHAR